MNCKVLHILYARRKNLKKKKNFGENLQIVYQIKAKYSALRALYVLQIE